MNKNTLKFFAVLFFAFSSQANSSFESIGIPMMKESVKKSFQLSDSAQGCPQAGFQEFDSLSSARGSAMSSSKIITQLLEEIDPHHREISVENSRCGSCRQVNEIAVFSTSEPEKVKMKQFCNNRPTVNVEKEMENSDVQDFASDTMRGKTPEGKELYAGCPDPCSFYVASATTPRSETRSLLNLTVHCGQPRNGGVLMAKYIYKAGLVQKWACQ